MRPLPATCRVGTTLAAATLLTAIALTGCGTAAPGGIVPATDPTTAPSTAPPGGYEVETRQLTLVDTSRSTAAGEETPSHPDRTLETTVVAPLGDGPFPLIVFSHGLTGNPSRHLSLARTWAESGYVVALPAFPLTSTDVPGAAANFTDVRNQPADVSFVIDQMLAADEDGSSPLQGRVDGERIGVAGHSLGAATSYAVTFDACCRDPRIDATVIMAGVILVDADRMDYGQSTPILLIHGDHDEALVYQFDVDVYAKLSPPKWFITLLGGTHSPPYEDTASPYDEVVETSTTDFWQGFLGGDPTALDRLATDAVVPGVSTLQSDP